MAPPTELPFQDSDGFGGELRTPEMPVHQDLYPRRIQAHEYCGLAYFPTELLIKIVVLGASSCSFTARSLALSCRWVADVTRAARLEIITVRTHDALESLNSFLCNSPRCAAVVRTLWIATNSGAELERRLVPEILRACINLRQLACQVVGIQALCDGDDGLSWARAHPLQLTLVDNMSRQRAPATSLASLWFYILGGRNGTTFLQHITHLHLTHHHFHFEEKFPAEDLPRLTHLAMSAKKASQFELTVNYHKQILDFARLLESVKLCLSVAVLVIRPDIYNVLPRPKIHDLVKTARDCRSAAKIRVFCVDSERYRELRFWRENALDAEDVWTLAEKLQTSDQSDSLE